MTRFEVLSLVIEITNTIIIVGGLIFTYRQLKLVVKTHSDNHKMLIYQVNPQLVRQSDKPSHWQAAIEHQAQWANEGQ